MTTTLRAQCQNPGRRKREILIQSIPNLSPPSLALSAAAPVLPMLEHATFCLAAQGRASSPASIASSTCTAHTPHPRWKTTTTRFEQCRCPQQLQGRGHCSTDSMLLLLLLLLLLPCGARLDRKIFWLNVEIGRCWLAAWGMPSNGERLNFIPVVPATALLLVVD